MSDPQLPSQRSWDHAAAQSLARSQARRRPPRDHLVPRDLRVLLGAAWVTASMLTIAYSLAVLGSLLVSALPIH